MGYGLGSRLALRLVGLPPKSIDLVATKDPTATTHLIALHVRLPSFSGHPICADLVSVGEDVHCESTAQEVHAGVSA